MTSDTGRKVANADAADVKLSDAQRWALLAAFHCDSTDWIHGNTINSLLKRGLIQWIDSYAYENGRGGYIATSAGRQLARTLERAA
jgi:hypothetical protein